MQGKTVYTQLAEEIGSGKSKVVPRIFETLLNETEARLVLAATPPAKVEELSARTGIDTATVETMIDPLFRKGVLFKSKKPDGTRYYRVRQVLQLHDSTAVMLEPPPGMLDLWKEWVRTESDEEVNAFAAALPHALVRVVPINVSLDAASQILASDDVSKLIDNARNISVTKCSCRAINGACVSPLEVCIQLDRAADYAIERGTGRKLSREEALRMLEMCEEQGLVHVAENKRGVGNVICNCCRDCCLNWPAPKTGIGKFVSPSRFRALVDSDECTGCEACIDRCFFDALQMVDGNAAVEQEKCVGCGVCGVVCVVDAISMQEVSPQESVPA